MQSNGPLHQVIFVFRKNMLHPRNSDQNYNYIWNSKLEL
jgi:hypothetical protein